ncbi:MAG: hypothetical protein MNPFHGCM_03301 [Gemmatimonadaceae bacterium]|nr:hypothetical protein [Gemmatimonadaceae bacterium]
MQARSLAEIPEPELVTALCDDPMLRTWLFAPLLTGPRDRWLLQVPFIDLGIGRHNSDLDAVLLRDGNPIDAVAYQIKRVKVTEATFATGLPGKLGEMPKAVRQANATAALGFARVVLTFLVVADGRTRTEFNFAFRGPTGEIVGAINRAIDLTNLHDSVGVARIEVVQPLDRDFTLAGGIGGGFLRQPQPREQDAALSAALERYGTKHGQS